MKTIIPCKITYSETDKCWYVEAPGFYDGIMTHGTSLEHAKEMAAEAASGIIETCLEQDIPFSVPQMFDDPDCHAIPLEAGLAFALWMRRRREARNMTLAEVAAKMGVKYQMCQKLENPRTANPTLKTLRKIEKVFGDEVMVF